MPSTLVPRARLRDRLTTAVRERAVTLVRAPAGAGKTIAVADWFAHGSTGWRRAWLTADANTDTAERFWRYVVQAIKQAGVALHRAEQAVPGVGMDVPFLVQLAADLLDRPQPVVLVVDSFDRVTSPPVLDGVDFLIRHAYPNLRLVLCSRGEPQLPIQRYRLADCITELGPSDLAFTAPESQHLLSRHGIVASSGVAKALTEDTEGWPAALRLTALALQRTHSGTGKITLDALALACAESAESIGDYLHREVLDPLSVDLQIALVNLSVTDQLWPDLAEALCGVADGQRLLVDLARRGAFIERTVDGAGGYRLHRLFRDMLHAQLQRDAADEVPSLHRVCAQWFAGRGDPVAAVRHAIVAGDWGYASDLVVDSLRVTSLLDRADADHATYTELLTALPADISGVSVLVVRAALAVAQRNPEFAFQQLRDAEECIGSPSAPIELRVSAALIRLAACAAGGGRAETAQAAAHAGALLCELPAPRRAAHPRLAGLVRGLATESAAARQAGPAAKPPPPACTPLAVTEPLTDREAEVLGYLAEMYSTQEIAAAMFVSTNTVRTHIRGILRKLGAHRRNVAVRRARELQLL